PLELGDRLVVRLEGALPVLERDRDLRTFREAARPGGPSGLHAELLFAADKLLVVVANESAGQQPGLAQHLESVADAENGQAVLGSVDHGLHDRRESRDGTAPEVIAVREPAGNDDSV